MTKKKEKQLALELRLDGYSYEEILDYFEEEGMHVSKGSLSNWLKGVEIPRDKAETLRQRVDVKRSKGLEKAREVRNNKKPSTKLATGGFA